MNTIKTIRISVLKLHVNPAPFCLHPDVSRLFTELSKNAPTLRTTKPRIDLTPSFQAVQQLSEENVSSLSRKAAFLLAVCAFLCPSDINRILASSIHNVSGSGGITFDIHKPKEKRNSRPIIKTIQIAPHHRKPLLFPVRAVILLNNHSALKSLRSYDTLSVNTKRPERRLSNTTISSWLRRLIRLSTTEMVSLLSVASTIALEKGIPLQDIVTLGNWSSAEVFQRHYNRSHTSSADFTNTLIPVIQVNRSGTEKDDDIFCDTRENPTL